MEIPTFYEAKDAVEKESATPLDEFIYYCEPQHHINPQWREQFLKLIEFLIKERHTK